MMIPSDLHPQMDEAVYRDIHLDSSGKLWALDLERSPRGLQEGWDGKVLRALGTL